MPRKQPSSRQGMRIPPCELCGKSKKPRHKTECCGHWVCGDESEYVLFSYARDICERNHRRYTLCGLHHAKGHKGDWRTCKECRNELERELEMYAWYGTNEYNFEKLPDPPAFQPTHCAKCGIRIRLGEDGYSITGKEYLCWSCAHFIGRLPSIPAKYKAGARILGKIGSDQLMRLITLALEFASLQPWRVMGDKEKFAVQDPESGTMSYNIVMGSMGTLYGLACYPGAEGYACVQEGMMKKGEISEHDEFQFLQKSMLVTFEPPEMIDPETTELYRTYGIRFPKDALWPNFAVYDPELFPAMVGEEHVQALEHVLSQACAVVRRFLETGGPEFTQGKAILTRVPEGSVSGITWSDQWLPPPPPPEKPVVDIPKKGARDLEAALFGKRSDLSFELDYFLSPAPVRERGERGFFPRVLLIVEPRSYYIAGSRMVGKQEFGQALADGLVEAARTLAPPSEIIVKRPEIAHALEPICARAGVKVTLRTGLPTLSRIKRDFQKMVLSGFPKT